MEEKPSTEQIQSSGIEPKYLFVALTLALAIGIFSIEQVINQIFSKTKDSIENK